MTEVIRAGAGKLIEQAIEAELTALLSFYDYPAEHWKHIRTSNPIESTFATVRYRTKRTKWCLIRHHQLLARSRSCIPATTLDSRDESPKGFLQHSHAAP